MKEDKKSGMENNLPENYVGKQTTVNFGRDLRMSQPWRSYPNDEVFTIVRKTKSGLYILKDSKGDEHPLRKSAINYFSNGEDKLSILKDAHKKYCEWWLPIDLDCNSCMGAMSCHRFCETLLTYNDEWWNRWLGDTIPVEKKQSFKSYILKMIVGHYTKIIDLNKDV
jgi:hypothetical protein